MLLRPATIQSICDEILLLGNHTPHSASLEWEKKVTRLLKIETQIKSNF